METEQVVQTPSAESSPAAVETPKPESSTGADETQSETPDLDSFTEAERHQWLLDGTVPKRESKAKTAEPAPGEKNAEQGKDGKPADAAKPGDGKTPASGPGKSKDAGTRVHQLLQERHQQDERIRQLEAQLASANGGKRAASPAATDGKTPARADGKADALPELKKPEMKDFDTWEKYEEAKDAYYEQMFKRTADEAVAKDRAERAKADNEARVAEANKAIEKSWKAKVDTAVAQHADFEQVALSPVLGKMIPQGGVVDAFILRNPMGAEVLYHLGSDLGEAERILALDPLDQAVELTRLADKLDGSKKAPSATPPKKTVSDASPPPRELGNGGKTPRDAADEALESGDFEAYSREMNARELKARSGT